jgi:signal peptidase I
MDSTAGARTTSGAVTRFDLMALRLARRLTDSLLIVEVLAVILVVFLTRVVPLTGGETLVIQGGSMVPRLSTGSAVVIERVEVASLRSGDVVSIRIPNGTVYTHRITRVIDRAGETWLETKGDANAGVDPALVPASWTIGRMTLALPYVGYLIRLFSLISGVLVTVCLAVSLLAAGWILESLEEDPGHQPPGAKRPTRREPRDRSGSRRIPARPTGPVA